MPIGTIVAGVIGALAMNGAEKLTEKSAETAFDNCSNLLETVRGLFVGEELTMLNLLERYPTNLDLQKEVAEKLTQRLESNPAVAGELEELLGTMPISET